MDVTCPECGCNDIKLSKFRVQSKSGEINVMVIGKCQRHITLELPFHGFFGFIGTVPTDFKTCGCSFMYPELNPEEITINSPRWS